MQAISTAINKATSASASLARFGHGIKTYPNVRDFKRPEKQLTLYLKESCPFSRKVREAMSELDLDATIKPCPIEGTRFRPELKKLGGQEQVPLLIDPNTDVKMYESENIAKYLFDKYGPGKDKVPMMFKDGYISTGTSRLSTIFRSLPWHGLFQYKGDDKTSLKTLIPKKVDDEAHETDVVHPPVNKKIILYSYEGSPNCRFVREALDSLEIPYDIQNMAFGSMKRDDFKKMTGKLQFPYLMDHNSERGMFESAEIVQYLYDTYPPQKIPRGLKFEQK